MEFSNRIAASLGARVAALRHQLAGNWFLSGELVTSVRRALLGLCQIMPRRVLLLLLPAAASWLSA